VGAGTASHVITESPAAYKQAIDAAIASDFSGVLVKWLESSGVLLKIACLSEKVSSQVHAFRTARELVASSRSQISLSAYTMIRDTLTAEVRSLNAASGEMKQLGEAFEQEVKRSDAFVNAVTNLAKEARPSSLKAIQLTEAHCRLLLRVADRLGELPSGHAAARAFRKFVSVVPLHDPGWAAIADIALARAGSIRARFPGLDRKALQANPGANWVIENSYTWHGKGEMFEFYGKRCRATADAANDALRAARQRAAVRGPDWTADITIGEMRLGRADQEVGGWSKFADEAVLSYPKTSATGAQQVKAGNLPVHGPAQPGALFQFKAESELRQSAIPAQQGKDLKRTLDAWAQGEPVYAAAMMRNEKGDIVQRIFLLEPPDPKAGLAFFGIGTSQAQIAERAELAARGALVTNIKADIKNQELRTLWHEIFWDAFESL
jgi:hypothetical protein